jgi:hypothetical protein
VLTYGVGGLLTHWLILGRRKRRQSGTIVPAAAGSAASRQRREAPVEDAIAGDDADPRVKAETRRLEQQSNIGLVRGKDVPARTHTLYPPNQSVAIGLINATAMGS